MNHVFTNLIKRLFSPFLKKLLPVLPVPTSRRRATLRSGSHTKDTGVSTSPASPSQSKKKTGQASERGRGKTSTKSLVFPIFPMTEERIAKPRTKSVPKKSTKSSKPSSPKSTGKRSSKTQTTSKARSN